MKATVLASIALGLSTALAAPFTPENAVNRGDVSNLMGDVSSINPNFGNHDIKPEERVADGTDSQLKENKLGSILNEKLASATKREREARDVHNTYLKEDIASGEPADENSPAPQVNDEN